MALALTQRRRTIAAAASLVAAVALAVAVAGRSCRVGAPGPDATVRAMMQAAKAGDRQAVFDLLSPVTQQRLEERARAATDLVGSSRRYTALELISIGGNSDDEPAPSEVRVVESKADRASVEVAGPGGRARVDLVLVQGQWRVHLPDYGTGI
jgi:hypothetical protein